MSERRSFWRKVSYIAAIVVLLIPMSWLSMPPSRGQNASEQGGKLARLRTDYGLGQGSIGEIDPASETMKLATLGMRGVAANILWQQANYYKKTENWTAFQAVLEQIARLQPNYISVWQYQAWNLSYNLSVEFDDYHDRYKWVMRGINYLNDGLRYNKDEPRLLWDMGWFIAQKIGRADEHVQYRRLFKADDDFHAGSGRTNEQRDNWLVGKYWFQETVDAVDFRNMRMKGKSPLIYRSDPAMSQINYADAIQVEGTHGEQAWSSWVRAAADWKKYGDQPILTSWDFRIQLNDLERRQEEAEGYRQQLEALEGGVRDTLLAERAAALTPEERTLSNLQLPDVPPNQQEQFFLVQAKLNVTPLDVAERIERDRPELAIQAANLARKWHEADRRADAIERYRETVNFNYWKARCDFEQTPEALKAHELTYKAQLAHEDQDLVAARALYEEAWPLWRKVLDEFPIIRDEGTLGEDLVQHIAKYRSVLEDLLEPEFPQDFILRDMVESFDRENLVKDVFITPEDKSPGNTSPDKTSPDKTTPDKTTPEKTLPVPNGEPATSAPEEGLPPEPVEENATEEEAAAEKTRVEKSPKPADAK